mgnify:CR=1 FL=1
MKRDISLYLHDIINAIMSIYNFIEGIDLSGFIKDDKTQSVVIRKFEIIGEAVKNLPHEILLNNPQLPWSYMTKMRDTLIHGSFDTDPEIIWETIHQDLNDIVPKVEKIIEDLKNNN